MIKKLATQSYELFKRVMTQYGIIHGDEHLNNVMLTLSNPPELKLIDFGRSFNKATPQQIQMRLNIIEHIFQSNLGDFGITDWVVEE